VSSETLDRLVREAQASLKQFINRAAGQNLRAMRKSWSKTK